MILVSFTASIAWLCPLPGFRPARFRRRHCPIHGPIYVTDPAFTVVPVKAFLDLGNHFPILSRK